MIFMLTICGLSHAQNQFLGKWKMYDVLSFKELESVEFDQREGFDAYILFKENMTFEKSVNGSIVEGKYEVKKNKLIFFEKDENGVYQISWSLRWPKNTRDPLPRTKVVDICYPELLTIDGRKVELDVYYEKIMLK